jgi:FAD-dependent urate hydroxylase
MTSRVLIIGGGIAGPVLAMALQQAGIESVVHEAYDRGADGVGSFLNLAPNGMDALRVLGLHETVGEVSFESPKIRLYLGENRALRDFSLIGERADGLTSVTLNRKDLYVRLRDEAVHRGIRIEYGKRLVDAETDAGGVTARFADGTTDRGDLLVGADGVRSAVRTLIDPDAPAARYVPLVNTGGQVRGIDTGTEPGVMRMMFGKRAFLGMVTAPDGEVWWFANVPQRRELSRAELAAVSQQEWKSRLLDLFSDDGELARRIISETDTPLLPWNTYDFPRVPVWHRNRMVIIGDAAHATSPTAGQGASMAVEDAVELARCLRDLPVDAAFAAYEGARRERVEKVVKYGKRSGDQKGVGPVTRLMLPLVFRLLPDPELRWLYDRQAQWEVPVR